MVTAEAKRDQIVAAAQAGVKGYIIKSRFTAAVLKKKSKKSLSEFSKLGECGYNMNKSNSEMPWNQSLTEKVKATSNMLR